MKKNIENVLKTVLSSEQIAVLKEEITSGIRKINSAVENNEKMKAKKDLMVQTFVKIDEMIEKSNRSPLLFKAFYAAAKSNIRKMIQPIIEEMMEEDEQIKNLDDIPDVKTGETKKPAKEEKKPEPAEKPEPDKKKPFQKNINPQRPKQKSEHKPSQQQRKFDKKDAGKNQKGR